MPALKALGAQLGALAMLLLLVRVAGLALPSLALALLQGVLAATLAAVMRSDRWWLPLHLCFAPAVLLAARLDAPGWLYLLPLCALLLVYGSSFRSQVPLFLSNGATVNALVAWLPAGVPLRILDAGSGTGSLALTLARRRADCQITGLEQALLPAAMGRFAARSLANAQLRRGDFWQQSFADYEVVYAFLSPVPMAALWRKAGAEMRPGSWLVSNSFQVPDRPADEIIAVADRRATRLYCYRIGT